MGWLVPHGASRRDLITELTPTERLQGEGVFRTLRHCCRGNVLYALHESGKTAETKKWIGVYLLQRFENGWGYKDMDESMGPNYYLCPVSYLDEADEPCNDYARQWRKDCRTTAVERKTRNAARRAARG